MEEKQRNKVLLLLFVGVLMGALDIAIVGPALPAIQAEFESGTRQMAWVFNIYVLLSLVSTPFMAKLSDRFGRRSIYVLDVALFGLGSLIVAQSDSFAMLIVGRAVQAIGAGGVLPVAAAVIGDTFPQEKRGAALGLIGAVFGIAFLVGPPLAGVILKYATWHWLFLINLPIALLLMAGAATLLPSTRPAERKPFDVPGMLLLCVLLGALALGITRLDENMPLLGLTSPTVGGPILLALVLMPVFWNMEKKAADPVLQPRLFRSRQMIVAGFLAAGTGMAETSGVFLRQLFHALDGGGAGGGFPARRAAARPHRLEDRGAGRPAAHRRRLFLLRAGQHQQAGVHRRPAAVRSRPLRAARRAAALRGAERGRSQRARRRPGAAHRGLVHRPAHRRRAGRRYRRVARRGNSGRLRGGLHRHRHGHGRHRARRLPAQEPRRGTRQRRGLGRRRRARGAYFNTSPSTVTRCISRGVV